MKDLIAKLEAAAEGSRELDCLIARAVGWHRVEPRFTKSKHGGWIAPEDFNGTSGDGRPILDSLHGTDIHRDPPMFSRSLDAARGLVQKGHDWCAGSCGEDDGPWATVTSQDTERGCPDYSASAATVELALTIASLKAIGATNGD